LALSLLKAQSPDAFQEVNQVPDWVSGTSAKSELVATKISEADQKKAALRQKNFSKRLDQMRAGLDELEHWLLDTLRQGIAVLEQQPYSFWKEISARLVDAKLGAIGKRLKNLPTIIGVDERWPELVLSELATYFLHIRALKKMEELPLNIQQDLLSFAGVNIKKDSLIQNEEPVKDTWMIIGQIEGVEDSLNFRRTWLLGLETRRFAMILDFAFGNNPYPTDYKRGSVFEGSIIFYPSNSPMRAIIQDKKILNRTLKKILGFDQFKSFLDFYSNSLAANPWQSLFPCSLTKVLPVMKKEQLFLIDQNQKIIPSYISSENTWLILAASGGQAIEVFGEWTGTELIPLSFTINQRYISLSNLKNK
jgi:hypothetical protein